MSTHKDLPPSSQKWAGDVDAMMTEMKALREVVRRLTENAGIDMANPKRGVNTGATPSVKSPVGQKLSSLADVGTYDVLEGQVLSWSQKGQKWLPVTLSAGGAIEIPMSYTNQYGQPVALGYGNLSDAPAGNWAYFATNETYGKSYAEIWATGTTYVGAGNFSDGPVALIEATHDGFGRPYVQISAEDYVDSTQGSLTVGSYFIRMDVPVFQNPRVNTADRPAPAVIPIGDVGNQTYDLDLKKPIWWDGVDSWRDALGTAV